MKKSNELINIYSLLITHFVLFSIIESFIVVAVYFKIILLLLLNITIIFLFRGNGIILDFSHSVNKYFYEQGSNTPYRRVSSKSSIWGSNEPGLTYWRWYWKKTDDEWEEYHTWVINFFLLSQTSKLQFCKNVGDEQT